LRDSAGVRALVRRRNLSHRCKKKTSDIQKESTFDFALHITLIPSKSTELAKLKIRKYEAEPVYLSSNIVCVKEPFLTHDSILKALPLSKNYQKQKKERKKKSFHTGGNCGQRNTKKKLQKIAEIAGKLQKIAVFW
jgi:hypothetical protein